MGKQQSRLTGSAGASPLGGELQAVRGGRKVKGTALRTTAG